MRRYIPALGCGIGCRGFWVLLHALAGGHVRRQQALAAPQLLCGFPDFFHAGRHPLIRLVKAIVQLARAPWGAGPAWRCCSTQVSWAPYFIAMLTLQSAARGHLKIKGSAYEVACNRVLFDYRQSHAGQHSCMGINSICCTRLLQFLLR